MRVQVAPEFAGQHNAQLHGVVRLYACFAACAKKGFKPFMSKGFYHGDYCKLLINTYQYLA